jgi:dipeptidyl aminopeptidase/acylaminoacyl peptidase
MKTRVGVLLAAASVALAAVSPVAARAAALPPLIPRERFFENPEKDLAKISPDGTRLAYLAAEGGKLNVFVKTLGKSDDRAVTHDHERGIYEYYWTRDGRRILYSQDRGGDENFRIFAADAERGDVEPRCLTPFDNVRAEVLAAPRATPGKILVQLNKRDAHAFDVYRLDIATGELSPVAENPGSVLSWHADASGRLRAYVASRDDGGREVFARDSESSPWRSVAAYTVDDLPDPIDFTADGRGFYLGSSKGSDTKRLVRLDLTTGAEAVLDEDPEADLAFAVVSDKTHEVLAAAYQRERLVYHFLDPKLTRDFARLSKVDPGEKTVTGFDADERRFVVATYSDVDAGTNYLFDRATGKAEKLFRSRPWLDSSQMAETKPITVTARDGVVLHGYLTLPRGVPAKGLPMVLRVHGGPWERDAWGFNPTIQFLANRGYAVLQVNYRGSTGYGKTFARMADHQFARKMHDDLIDAVSWVVAKGVADPKRVAIYGGSYGGYATLVGLTFTPDVFACGVDLCGPTSLVTLIKSFPPYWRPWLQGHWYRFVGNPDDPAAVEDMKARSPLYHIENVKRPLFVAQGANDVRVTQAESDRMVEALRAAGKEVEYMLAANEGHGFANPENRIEFYRRMEAFLAKHIGGRKQD